MCTVSFLPTDDGFLLAMNRDEQLARGAAQPPQIWTAGRRQSLYPYERSGGTWIGINDAGLIFALINWYSRPQLARANLVSRGEVIPALLRAATMAEAGRLLAAFDGKAMNPFRLIVASWRERSLCEWRSNGGVLECISMPWKRAHWFSSGFDEAEASRARQLACARAARQSPPDSEAWLRELHRSHHPSKSAVSICMHRADAGTVSCTEISVNARAAAMTYSAGPACEHGPSFTRTLRLSPRIPCPAA